MGNCKGKPMAYKNPDYKPIERNQKILSIAWSHVQSVPYQVSLRWLFYRLLQAGVISGKTRYDWFVGLVSKARTNYWEGWRPDTLADDTRTAVIRGTGERTAGDWLEVVRTGARCHLDFWYTQSVYLELWFEAKAMRYQFEHYTKHITLRPFGGDASIPYKWEMVEALELARKKYRQGIIILYFGDLDPKGEMIPESVEDSIRYWSDVGFNFIRAGLNPGDEVKYNLPENPEDPGKYQWEALEDDPARDLITSAVGRFVDYDAMERIEALENDATASFRRHLDGLEL